MSPMSLWFLQAVSLNDRVWRFLMDEATMMTLQSVKITWYYLQIPWPISHGAAERRIDPKTGHRLIVPTDCKSY